MMRALMLCLLLCGCGPTQRDDTDPPSGAASGLELFTDAGTGCQYVGVYQRGIVPRIGSDGRHMGCRGLR